MWRFVFISCCLAAPALADSVVATRPISANTAVSAQDVTMVAMAIPGALDDLALAIGFETRVAIHAGRALTADDIGPSTQIARNARVTISFTQGGLEIITEGRALTIGSAGDVIDVMNLASRSRVSGRIGTDGVVHVAAGQ